MNVVAASTTSLVSLRAISHPLLRPVANGSATFTIPRRRGPPLLHSGGDRDGMLSGCGGSAGSWGYRHCFDVLSPTRPPIATATDSNKHKEKESYNHNPIPVRTPRMAQDPKKVEVAIGNLKSIVGLDDKNATDLSTKPERVEELLTFFKNHNITANSAREQKAMLYSVWAKVKITTHRDPVANFITDKKLDSAQKVDAAIKFVNGMTGDKVDLAQMAKECGVGVKVTKKDVETLVANALKSEDLLSLKAAWEKNPNMLIGRMRRVEGMRWADISDVKAALDVQVPALVKDVVLAVSSEKNIPTPSPAASGEKKEMRVCPRNDDFRAVSHNLPMTHIGDIKGKEGSTVYVVGWAHRVRHQSRMTFVVLRDGSGFVQCVFDGATEPFHRETSVAIRGTIKNEPKAKSVMQPAIELHVEEYAIIGPSDGSIETTITAESSVDKLLDQRHIVLRGTNGLTVMKVRHEVLRAFREFFWSKNYYEVTPPTLVQTQCEGGSTLFDVMYYNEKAYLTQSSQLYLETVTASLGNVYCCLPSYRAEKSKTKRHLSEYTHLEVEYDVCTFEELLERLEDMICNVYNTVIARVGDMIAFLNPEQVIDPHGNMKDVNNFKFTPRKPFRRLPYADAIAFCNKEGIINPETGKDFKFGEDISDQPERAMVAKFGEFIFMTHFPVEMKSFYMQRASTDRTLTESVDVLAPGVGEIVGGSMRMWDYEELMEGYKREGLDPSIYYWYTEQRKYGGTPHGGFGLGIERFLVWLLDLNSVKEACMFPRYMGRCKP